MEQRSKLIKIRDFIVRNRFYIICGFLILVRFLYCVRISGRQSFAADEMSEMGFIAKANSLKDILMYFLTVEITNLPLFALIAAAWYRIVPWGESWLLLLCELLTSTGIFFVALAARKLKDDTAGYFAAAFCVISSTLILRCDMEYRCYSFLYMAIALCLYLYICRQKRNGNEGLPEKGVKQELILGVAMTVLAYAHYFGPLIIVALFVADAFLFLKKRLGIKFVIPYMMSGLLLLPWFLLMLKFKEKSITDFWPSPPTLGSIPEILRFVLSYDEPIYVYALIAMLSAAVLVLWKIREGRFDWGVHYPLAVSLWVIWFLLLGVFVYSSKINIYGSIWVDKYFISLIPFLVLIMAFFASVLMDRAVKPGEKELRGMSTAVICAFLVMYFGLGNYYHDVKEYTDVPLDPYREAALYLRDNAPEDGEIPLLVPTEGGAVLGFQEFYLDHYGLGDRIRVVSWYEPEAEEIVKNSDRFYVFDVRGRIEKSEEEAAETLKTYKPSDSAKEYGLNYYERGALR